MADRHDRRAAFVPPIAFVLLVALTDGVAAQKFYRDDPLTREPPPVPAIDPGPRDLSFLLEAVSSTFGKPGERHPRGGVIRAQNINTLGEVLDGAWYVNRHARERMTPEALRRGSGDDRPPSAGPWRVLLIRNHRGRPTIVFRDQQQQMYLMRFDPADAPELATGAQMISSRFFHALGYHVAESNLVTFERERLVVETNASDVTSFGTLRALIPEDIDRLLEPVARGTGNRYRAVAMRVPAGELLLGPFQLYGTRSDDPNDVVPHEHRRELRGLHVFSAWLNYAHFDALHTFDMLVHPEGEPQHVRHYLYDFMATLGSGMFGPKQVWEGRDPVYGQDVTLRNIVGFGIYSPAWMRAKYPDLPAVGRFEANTFEPDKWTPLYEVASFANRLPDDTFWAARKVMAFSDDDIRAIVGVAQYSNPDAERWIADRLIERRNRIGETYFRRVLPLADFSIRNGELVFSDLAVQQGLRDPRRYRTAWWVFDNVAGKASTEIAAAAPGTQVPSAAAGAPAGSYVMARLSSEGVDPAMTVSVYLRSENGGLRVVGIDHAWPGRTLVDPRVIVPPARNRYAELEPARQQLFDTFARELNAKTGQTLSMEEQFRALSPSQQTTFDGVTHALMRATLTDSAGRSLGNAIDLVTGVDRIAGQQAGRSGDQQFRLYVALRPDARDIMDRSREFVRGHENTVYHAGYPISYRMGDGVPSIQFSLAADGLTADVDVDYRGSKAPQSLFNGHLTSANSDVRAGDNAQRHGKRWNGFVNWWGDLFGNVQFADGPAAPAGPFGTAPTRTPTTLPPNRPAGASIPELSDAVQEFLTDWLVRRDYGEAATFLAPDAFGCVAESMNIDVKAPPERLRPAARQLLERAAKQWGRPRNLTEAMNPVLPWSPVVRVTRHAFDQDFTIVEAPTELGAQYACGAPPPKTFVPASTPEYGTYYGALLQVVHEGQTGGTLVLVWRRLNGEWRIVSYRAID